MQDLKDRFGRRFSYLRLSITDVCNFRCSYCLPHGYQKSEVSTDFLTLFEIENLITAMSEMGTWKVRLTGGEPSLRRDLVEIAQAISKIPGIKRIALSTNGYRLKQMARSFLSAGITAINVSVDSLDPRKFQKITGYDRLHEILEGIEEAIQLGFHKIKMNAVLLQGWNSDDLKSFIDWIRFRPVSVRFIELMPTGQTRAFFQERHFSSQQMQDSLLQLGWLPVPRNEADGPALEYEHLKYQGKIGIIAPYSKDFCSSCNRLRVTSKGELRLCLFGEGNHSLRHLLQSSLQKEELKELICSFLQKKEISHYLPEGRYGNNQTFSAMGG